jgi:prolyl-tRNA synthetase
LRIEVGPRDIAEDKVMVGRRDVAGKGQPLARAELVATAEAMLTAIQYALFAAAKAAREAASRRIDDLNEFEAFFTPKDEERPEIHGGLAYSHFVDSPEMDEKLKALKVTIRCVPLDAPDEPGKCIFTGQASTRRGVFAKAY